jgi:benzoyl-CoA 2,3-dioxygenase component A
VQLVHGVHLALPDGVDRQLADHAEGARLQHREQLEWDVLPAELTAEEMADAGVAASEVPASEPSPPALVAAAEGETSFNSAQYGATVAPWSAAHPFANLYGPKAAEKSATATVTGNVRVTEVGKDYDTHHIVLDFGAMPFPVWKGSPSASSRPAATSAAGRIIPGSTRSRARATASDPGYNNVSLTIKRVLEDTSGKPVRGVASNYMCDLKVGDKVEVIGPFGTTFLMPNHPRSHVVMICTGTGSAPMRAMTEWRRRLRASGKFEGGKLMLFFGARTKEELPYFGPLQSLPKDFIDINLAFSRTAGRPSAMSRT